jgi:hypothetical protein
MDTGQIFIAGAIGAIAPEIVRLYEIRTHKKITFTPFYFVISAAYVALGGYIATIFPGITGPFWAACVGAGLVLVVNKMVYIGGQLADRLATPFKAAPARTRGDRGGFGHGEITEETTRRGSFLDYASML